MACEWYLLAGVVRENKSVGSMDGEGAINPERHLLSDFLCDLPSGRNNTL